MEVLYQALPSLQSCVREHTDLHYYRNYLFATKSQPFFVMELLVKSMQVRRGDKIDEGVPDIAVVLCSAKQYVEVEGQVEEVVEIRMSLVDLVAEKLQAVLVWDVLYHYRRSAVPQDVRVYDFVGSARVHVLVCCGNLSVWRLLVRIPLVEVLRWHRAVVHTLRCIAAV